MSIEDLAKDHWEYTKEVIRRTLLDKQLNDTFPLLQYLYVEAFKHGYKHGLENKNEC
jgi:hypothetical protein